MAKIKVSLELSESTIVDSRKSFIPLRIAFQTRAILFSSRELSCGGSEISEKEAFVDYAYSLICDDGMLVRGYFSCSFGTRKFKRLGLKISLYVKNLTRQTFVMSVL